MCVKIVRTKEEFEFNPAEPLEYQVRGAKKVIIDYDPDDTKIDSFMQQIERIIKTGAGCSLNIQVNPNNTLAGLRLERHLNNINKMLDVNNIVKSMTLMHHEIDKRISEIKDMCMKEPE